MRPIYTGKQPLVSIMMPVYNGENDIELSLKSLLYQTYTNWECIVVNDGSTDSTIDIVNSFSDKRIHLHSFDRNFGRPFARQKALELAKGKYLTMLDADDWYYPEKLKVQVDLMENHLSWVLLSSPFVLTKDINSVKSIQSRMQSEIVEYFSRKAMDYEPLPHASSIIRMSVAKNLYYDTKLKRSQDQDFMMRLVVGRKYAIYNVPLYVYNLGESISLRKYFKAQFYGTYILRKHVSVFSTIFILASIKIGAKVVVATLAYLIGCFNRLMIQRGNLPTEKDCEVYMKNLNSLNNVL